MRLFTNGCSFTYGAEIINNELGILYEKVGNHDEFADKFRSENNWSFFLNQKLNSTLLTNCSTGGGSNKRIFRTTIDFFIDLMSKKECVNDYVAVIQWTEINRCEVYDNIIEDFAFLSIRDPWGKPEHIDYIRDRYSVLSQELMKLDEQNSLEDFKSCMLALSGFFEKHKIKYLFCNMNPKSLRSLPSYFLESYNWLGKDIEQSSITKILVEEGNNTQKYFYPYKHPSVEGHKIIAEKLYNRLQELYTL